MNLADLSIKRPIFITCIFGLTIVLGIMSVRKLGVDLFPNVTFPIVAVTTIYPGAGPLEIETLVTKPIEDSLSTISGMKSLRSINKESLSLIIAEFTLETDVKYAQQQIRDRLSSVRGKLPTEIKDPVLRLFDPSDQPILMIALSANLTPAELFDLADQEVRPLIEQVKDVGLVDVLGGRKREIQVLLDRQALKSRALSATQVAQRIGAVGKNIPAGKSEGQGKEADVRTVGEFESLKDIEGTLVSFFANETPIRVADVAQVKDSLVDEKTRTFVNGKQALTIAVYRRSGANTVAVADGIKKRVEKIKKDFSGRYEGFTLDIMQDSSKPIRANLDDVKESIFIGIALTVLVVFFFLGSARSTVITGLALPNSLLGAFVLMAAAGFSINIMTLLAMSLAVGLLIDDAIVVRENIFRHIEMGKNPVEAASEGTKQVTMAVIATTLTVIAVFGPVAFLDGIVGQFFKEFGLTICFIMGVSLFDALTMAPMLSAYFAGNLHAQPKNFFSKGVAKMLAGFNRIQDGVEAIYMRALEFTMVHPMIVLMGSLAIFLGSFGALYKVPKTFIPPSDTGEFQVAMDAVPGTRLEDMASVLTKIDEKIRAEKETHVTVLTAGGINGEPNEGTIFVQLVGSKERNINTSQFKDKVRAILAEFPEIKSKVQDVGGPGGAQQPFNVNIAGTDLAQIEKVANALFEKIRNHPDLNDVDITYRPGKPQMNVVVDKSRAEQLGVSTTLVGAELRTLVEGAVPAVYRQNGREYDIRVRLSDTQKNLANNFSQTFVPNLNFRLIPLSQVAKAKMAEGPSTIYREDRGRYIQISAAIAPNGKGMAAAISDVNKLMTDGSIEVPAGVRFQFVGQAESFQELGRNMMIAAVLAVLFIYLVLASLYESFVTPFTIMLVLPLAACGAFYGLFLARASLDLFSMIGCIMLLGIATKNSILLVDYINQLMQEGWEMKKAIMESGRTRLRPIIMTSFALIAGMLPVAIGLNEASKQRTSMGIAVIGGLVTSTLLTLVVVPAAYSYIERARRWGLKLFSRVTTSSSHDKKVASKEPLQSEKTTPTRLAN